ncbi:hypothetical protein [Bradyrhizobium yuanmingense]|uniref:hypothetical protein n=1 Tax=Bradyrhizobium yuanmingense TaxID=108015 RepID=UPI003B96C4E4
MTTLLFRRKAQDLFDLFYSIVFSGDFPVSRAEVVRTFLKKSIYDAEAQQARMQLLAVPLQLFRDLRDDLVTPKASRITFDMIQGRFGSLIEELFELSSRWYLPALSTAVSGLPWCAPSAAAGALFPPRGKSSLKQGDR